MVLAGSLTIKYQMLPITLSLQIEMVTLRNPIFASWHNDLQLLAPSVFAVMNRLFKFWVGP